MKLPDPDPSTVLVDKVAVGPDVVLQQTPLSVTALPLSLLIYPPQIAVVVNTEFTGNVINNGTRLVITVTSLAYCNELPALLYAYTR